MPDDSSHARSTVKYRCVCGQDALVHLSSGGTCDSCGREISAEMLLGNVSQTIDIPGSAIVGAATGALAGASTVTGVSVPEEDLTGQTFGHYRIVGPLGHGGMGSVYRALDESLQRYPEAFAEPSAYEGPRAAFYRELQAIPIAATLQPLEEQLANRQVPGNAARMKSHLDDARQRA